MGRVHSLTTSLFCHSYTFTLSIVEVLLKKGASVHTKDIRGETVVAIATRNGQIELLDVLKEKDQTPSTPKDKTTAPSPEPGARQRATDLHLAVQKDSVEKVKELLATGKYPVNAKNQNGVTPLHIAAFQ
jgi:ankyrin repeat protein